MLMGVNGMNNGINYDPMNPMGTHSWRKDAKAANRIAGLVTKYAPAPPSTVRVRTPRCHRLLAPVGVPSVRAARG